MGSSWRELKKLRKETTKHYRKWGWEGEEKLAKLEAPGCAEQLLLVLLRLFAELRGIQNFPSIENYLFAPFFFLEVNNTQPCSTTSIPDLLLASTKSY